MTSENFGECLKTYRKEHFLTQEQMAERLGLSANHLCTLERGKKHPRPSTIAAFCKLFGNGTAKWEGRTAEREGDSPEVLYAKLWRELKQLEPQKRKELVEMFARLIDWM